MTSDSMTSEKFNSILLSKIKDRRDVSVKEYKLKYKKGVFKFLKISSKRIGPKDKILLIRAGIHGEETAGPFSLIKYINQILDYLEKKNLKAIIYPLGNPSGFEDKSRHNIDGDEGLSGNNDFVYYQMENGKLVDDLGGKRDFKKWYWSSDKKLKIRLPAETVLMHKLIKKDPLGQVAAVIDLHQDFITQNLKAGAYHYAFGNLRVYDKIINSVEKIVPLLKNKYVGIGREYAPMKTDAKGFIKRHDGSLPDLFYRLGVKHSLTIETTGKTPLADACKVNLIWILGIADLLSNRATK